MSLSLRTTRVRGGFARAAVAVGLVAALLVALFAAPAQTVGSTKSSRSYGVAAEKATNVQRLERGRKKLKPNACLATYAARHAKKLAKSDAGLEHQSLSPVLQACGLREVGENVALGYASGKAVVTQGWMKSPGHRRNILTRSFTHGEVVARRSASGRWYAVQVFGTR